MTSHIPQAANAERWLVGALAYRPINLRVIAKRVRPEHFYNQALADLYARLLAERPRRNLMWEAPWSGMIAVTPQVSRPDLYADEVLEAHRRRELLQAAYDLKAAIIADDKAAIDEAFGRVR